MSLQSVCSSNAAKNSVLILEETTCRLHQWIDRLAYLDTPRTPRSPADMHVQFEGGAGKYQTTYWAFLFGSNDSARSNASRRTAHSVAVPSIGSMTGLVSAAAKIHKSIAKCMVKNSFRMLFGGLVVGLLVGTAGSMPRFVGFYDTGYNVSGQPRGGTDPNWY